MEDKKRLSAKEVLTDIENGLSDEELKQKYRLSEAQIESFFRKLVEAGYVTREKLDARKIQLADLIDLEPAVSSDAAGDLRAAGPYQHRADTNAVSGGQQALDAALKRYSRNAVIGIIVGFIVNLVAQGAIHLGAAQHSTAALVLGAIALILGLSLYFWGFHSWAKRKGYHGALALVGILGCGGLLIMALLPDKYKPGQSQSYAWVIVVIIVAIFIGVALLGIIAAVAIPYYVSYKRTACDHAAKSDLAKLTTAIQRLQKESVDLNVRFDEEAADEIAAADALKYLVGPHYGWGGCSKKCEVVVRMTKDNQGWIIEAAALKGTHPAGPQSCPAFRSRLRTGKELPPTVVHDVVDAKDGNARTWNSYPAPGPSSPATCYGESLITKAGPREKPGFRVRVPREAPCQKTDLTSQ